ncbi:hypothetical protein KM043_007489 [Ampulex compressa]|nr:hypothetical protein KM043_007489 [Ampulex compressa]
MVKCVSRRDQKYRKERSKLNQSSHKPDLADFGRGSIGRGKENTACHLEYPRSPPLVLRRSSPLVLSSRHYTLQR